MYSNSCCSCSFEREIIQIGLSSHKKYSNNIVNFQESTTILNGCTKKKKKKKEWKLIQRTTYLEKANEVKVCENDAYKKNIQNKAIQTNSNLYINNTFSEIFQHITCILIVFVKYSSVCVCVYN